MLGGNVLDITPLHYYDFDVRYTFNYYLNITVFPWLEVGYTCTLNYANKGSTYFPEQSWGKYTNQDRSFNFRLRVWKEGWWKTWTPQIVIGVDDPGTHDSYGGGGISSRDQNGGNCFSPVTILLLRSILGLIIWECWECILPGCWTGRLPGSIITVRL